MDSEEFNQRLIDYISQLKSLPKVIGVEEILLPGEKEASNLDKNIKNGLELSESTIKDLFSLAADIGIDANLAGLEQISV